MISIGIAQTANSVDIQKNFHAIFGLLQHFEKTEVDLVLFPECSLSGFTAKMKECNQDVLQPYLDLIQTWVTKTGIEVVLPTAFVENEKIYNSGFWFTVNGSQQFYKIGLTDSEVKFFSTPVGETKKVFSVKGFNFGILICFEAEQPSWSLFEKGRVDAILWPGYWGWTLDDVWESKRADQSINPIFENMKEWQVPLLQSNFSFNDLDGHKGAGPEGLSFAVDHDNKLVHRGPHSKMGGFIVTLEKINGNTKISKLRDLVD